MFRTATTIEPGRPPTVFVVTPRGHISRSDLWTIAIQAGRDRGSASSGSLRSDLVLPTTTPSQLGIANLPASLAYYRQAALCTMSPVPISAPRFRYATGHRLLV